MDIFVVHRNSLQVIGVTSVVLALDFQSNDIVVCHCFFFVFCNFVLRYCMVVKSRYMSVEI